MCYFVWDYEARRKRERVGALFVNKVSTFLDQDTNCLGRERGGRSVPIYWELFFCFWFVCFFGYILRKEREEKRKEKFIR